MNPARLAPVLSLAAALALAATAAAQVPGRNLQLLAHRDDYPPAPGGRGYSACWSYVHGDGREYAAIGTTHGTAIYNVTDPAAAYRVGFIPGPSSIWRGMRSYREWIYIVTEGVGPAPAPGIQVVRMANPENPTLVATVAGSFIRSHTVSADTGRALLVCNGSRDADGRGVGMFILSLADPEAPVELARWPDRFLGGVDSLYVHDSHPVGDRLYASCVYAGVVRVFDIADPAAPAEIAAWSYPGGFTHNAWTDESGRWLYVTDEVKGEPLKIFDIADVHAPRLVNAITSNPDAVIHNAYVRGDELYLANFTEGLRVLDLSDPAHPAEFAWADSWPGDAGPFFGVWGACPYFPSGTVIASDMQSGLYVYRPVRDYGIVHVRVVDGGSDAPLAGARVTLTSQGDSLVTPADGAVRFAPSPGPHAVEARKFGYVSAAAAVGVAAGSRDTVTLSLAPIPTADLAGTVRDAITGAPLEDAEVRLAGAPLHAHTDAAGRYALAGVPDGVWSVEVRRPGYVPVARERRIGPGFGGGQEYALLPAAYWDALEAESGWTVGAPGDDAASGVWVRVAPFGAGGGATGARSLAARGLGLEHGSGPGRLYPRPVQPDRDRTPGAGTMCFVTGQGADRDDIWENPVSGGVTTLTSPAFDLGGMSDPAIGYWRWFYADGDANDWLAVLVSGDDGATWAPVDTVRGMRNRWEEGTVRVADHVAPSAAVRVRFVAAERGPGSIVEAAIDDVIAYDADLRAVEAPAAAPRSRLAFRPPSPNPATAAVRLVLETPRAGEVEVVVADLAGRRVRTLHRGPAAAGTLALVWDGADAAGRPAPAGLYFARAAAGGEGARTRFVLIR